MTYARDSEVRLLANAFGVDVGALFAHVQDLYLRTANYNEDYQLFQSDWLENNPNVPGYIQNKPEIPNMGEIESFITDAVAQLDRPDWLETDPLALTYIQNKPDIVQADWNEADDASLAFILNKPAIEQADWDEADPNDPAFINNKPDFLLKSGGTVSNLTVSNRTTVKRVTETVATLGTALSPTNGTVQTKTLTAAVTLTEGTWADGEAVVVTYTGAETHAINHPAAWRASDGFPSTLKPVQEIIYRKIGGIIRYSPGAGWET